MRVPARYTRARLWAVLACLAALSGPSVAEVAVIERDSGAPIISVVGIIVSDPDPVGNRWQPLGSTNPARHVLNPNGTANGDGRPAVIRHPLTDMPIVAWAKNGGADRDIVVSRFENGAWSAEAVVVDGATDQLDPALAVDPSSGTVHLVYWVDGLQPKVLHTTAPADLSSWSPPQQISAPGELALRPSAVHHGGALRVAYEVHDSGRDVTPRRIELASVAPSSVVREVVAYSQWDAEHRVEVHQSGNRFWIDWLDGDGQMGWRRCVTGAWDVIDVESFAGAEEQEFHVRGAISKQAIQ